MRNGRVPIQRENLEEYDPEGKEPEGLQVTVVEQGEHFLLDAALLGRWTAENLERQLNGQVRAVLGAPNAFKKLYF